jgi:hypothetical protein
MATQCLLAVKQKKLSNISIMKSIRNFFGRSDSSNKSIVTDHSGHKHHNHEEQTGSMHKHTDESTDSTREGGKYFCPMKCEGDKLYDQPGICPVCNMHLVPLEDK